MSLHPTKSLWVGLLSSLSNIVSRWASRSLSSDGHNLCKHSIFQLLVTSSTKMKNFQEWSATCSSSDRLVFFPTSFFSTLWTKDFSIGLTLDGPLFAFSVTQIEFGLHVWKGSLSGGLESRLLFGNSLVLMMEEQVCVVSIYNTHSLCLSCHGTVWRKHIMTNIPED